MLALCGCGLNIDVAMFVYTIIICRAASVRWVCVCLVRSTQSLLYMVAIAQSKVSADALGRITPYYIVRCYPCRAIYYILYSSPAFMRKKRFTEMYAQMAVMKMPKSSTAQAVMAKTCQVMMLSMFSW